MYGGHLATITDSEEQNFITGMVSKSGKVCWLGASDTDVEGTWKWITDEDFSYSNWKSGEPNNSGGNENYLGVYLSNNSYKWNDFTVDSSTVGGFICEWDSIDNIDYFIPKILTADDEYVNTTKSIGNYAFNGCTALTDVYYSDTEEKWQTVTVGTNNTPLIEATFHFAHTHNFGEWEVDIEPTCAKEGKKHKTCSECEYANYEAIEKVAHTYELEVVPPTYIEQGYTLYTCSVCGDEYRDIYVNPLERIDLSNATLELEYTSAYYEGFALMPNVTLTYDGEIYDSSKELKITYADNNKAGTATVIIEGINRFVGTVELQFEIAYEVIPAQIVNVVAIGEIDKVSLSWGESSEVNTDSYNIYRKATGEKEYQLIKTVKGRDTFSYEDKNVEKEQTYSYYVTGVGLYGAESEPSMIVTATVLVDKIAPTVLKVSPASASVISGKTTLSATATDNIGVTKIAYFYSIDNGENWNEIGESTSKNFSIIFDTSKLDSMSVKVKAVAFDAAGNESEPIIVVYSLDNIGPEKVTGLSAVTLSSKITLSWNDVTANDAAYFILQTKINDEWSTVAKNIKTLGYTITNLHPDTDYIFRVACVDTHGNIGEYSDEFTARTATDETAPVITSQSPNSARYNSKINFSATAKDDCDIETVEIQVSMDLNSWTTISKNTYNTRTYNQTYSYSIDLSEYSEGSIFVRAIATDFSGNVSDTSDAAPYTEYIVDKTAPEAPVGISANGNDGYITVSWSMGKESDLGKYFVYKSTSLTGNYQLVASNLSSLNYHDRDVQSGREFYYKVKVSDTCGNMSEYSNAVSATMSPDTQAPEITGISSTYQQKISEKTHTINVTANDNNKLSRIVVEYNTAIEPEYKQLTVEENINNNYKSISVILPVENLNDGDKINIRAYAVDMAGLQSEYVTTTYTMDKTAPSIKEFTVSLDVSTVQLAWIDCKDSDLAGFKVYRSIDGKDFTLLGSRAASSTGAYSFIDTITATESNTYTYKLESIDKLGNTTTWTKSVDYTYVYSNEAPIAKMSVPDYMSVGVEQIFDASGSADDIAIEKYLWDFGDGTTSTEIKPVKSYNDIGTYTVKLSVTDNEGIISSVSKEIEVKERDMLGTLNVKVVNENGRALSYVPVYFDLGSDNQKIIYTDASGVATLQMLSGTHTIGMYASGYLPVKKDAVVLANATRTVTLTTVEEDIVTGNFEITRMTFDEIVAAGIDVYNPANQNIYSATVRVTYGSTPPLTINYVRNDDKIINYTVTDSNGKPITYYTNSNGENRKITGITYIPSSQGDSDVVAIMDIPAESSYLKEFFDVRLHIVNNASTEFTLEKNEVVLNVPDGMTLMTSVDGTYSTSNTVKIESIKGQETVTLAWVLRGDETGEYNLSADFTGTLAEFNELVTAHFKAEDPIKVYGLEGVKFRILTADEIHNDTLYFNIELENERDIDIYMPAIGLTDKIKNVTESVLHNNAEDDFFSEAYILNAYIQNENGQKQYVPISYDANGKAKTLIETLTPGQKIVYEYVAYNAINYDGIAYFKDAAITEFKGILDNIETGSFHKELYSFTDYSAKLDAILLESDADVNTAFDYIKTNGNYYYVSEAEDSLTNVCQTLYSLTDLALNADISIFTQEEERQLIKQIILSILADSSSVQMVEELQAQKYLTSVRNIVNQAKDSLIGKCDEDILNAAFDEMLSDSKNLAMTYIRDGEKAFYTELYNKIGGYGLGIVLDGEIKSFFNDIGVSSSEAFSSTLIKPTAFAAKVIDALEETQRDAYISALLKMECNAEYSNYILDSIISNASSSGMSSLIIDVASDLKQQINSSMTECYDYVGQFYANLGTEVGELALKSVLRLAIKSTPLSLAGKIFAPINSIFNFDSFYKQQDALDVYNAMGKTLIASFNDTTDTRNEDTDFYSMCILKALCELRLAGEAEFKSFMNDYMEGKYALPLSEETVLKQINRVMNTSYTSIDKWYDDVQYNIVHSRDILFNVEDISKLETPRAPVVSLDYDKLQTAQSFTSEYEYCFADGVWITCSNKPITFKVGVTPSVLRIRKATGDTNFAGDITTVKIYARKDLSKLITVKFDGTKYLISNLSSEYNYQLLFCDNKDEALDWSKSITIAGSDNVVDVFGISEYPYVVIRSCQNSTLYETTSNPLERQVQTKKELNLVTEGYGEVLRNPLSTKYFIEETIDLIASAFNGAEFKGWYQGDTCLSRDIHYVVEMSDNLNLVAKFTGPSVTGIYVTQTPKKLIYLENEPIDLNGLEVAVTYSDGSVKTINNCLADFQSNKIGNNRINIYYAGLSASYDIVINHHEAPWMIVENATCSHEGLEQKLCYICKNVIETRVIEKKDHTPITVAGKHATCVDTGTTDSIVCSVCSTIIFGGDIIPATGEHSYVKVVTAPTCVTQGYTTYTCSVCGDSYSDSVVEALGHTEVTIGEAKDATCTEDGITAGIKCSVCDEIIEEQQVIKAKGHKYVSEVIEPTCTTDGYTTHTCSVCDDSYIDNEVKALGHTEVTIGEAKDVTCTEDGITAGIKCSVCDEVIEEQQVIRSEGHKYVSVVTKPSCTSDGYTTYTCSVCDDTYTSDVVSKTGHSWTWVVDKDATCGADGSKHQECKNCDAVQAESTVIPATGHTDTNNDGYCNTCGTDLGTSAPSDNCDHICHKTGFMGFIYKIIRIFWKIFKTNQYCSCGAAHY
ncbi:MAG: PKD domain-containing protein [Faecalibacterium sp.]|nr:PKD domain-containing protein [Faecalibacterium sp.]